MTKKKRDRVDIKEILARPWCYYCERDFDDQKVLISHQKAKHFKCDNCNRRLNTAGGLSVHLQQVHKETLTCVANAIEGREKVEPEIFGMMGIPDELLEAHAQRTEAEFKRVEDERRALTGNPPPGQKNGEPNTKKRKIETPEELKARLQDHRAKRAAEKQAEQESKAARSASITPDPAQAHPAHMHQVSNFPAHTAAPAPYGAPPAFQFPTHPPPSFSPPGQGPYAPPQFSSYPPNYSPMPGQMSGSPSPPIGTPYAPAGPPGQMWGATPPGPPMGAPHAPGGPPRQMSGATPPGPPLGVPYAPAGPYRQNSLPTAPGLPRRPSFDVPGFNRHDMQRMHTGQALPPKPQAEAPQSQVGPPQPPSGPPQTQFGARQFQFGAPKPRSGARHPWQLDGAGDDADVDHPMEPTAQPKPLQQAENTEVAQPAAVKEVSEEASKSRAADLESSETKKKGKKQKPSQSKLVFNDKNESPEEKMATWRKFHFVRSNDTELVEGEVSGAVTGVTVDQDTVLDPQN